MTRTALRVVWLLLVALPALARPAAVSLPGVYLARDGSHAIELFLVDAELRGRIAWTRDPAARDTLNEDPTLRARPVAGIEHLRGLKRDEGGGYTGGVLYNPEDGKRYDASLRLEGDTLVIRGTPRIAVLGNLLGALFGRIKYDRVQGAFHPTPSVGTPGTH